MYPKVYTVMKTSRKMIEVIDDGFTVLYHVYKINIFKRKKLVKITENKMVALDYYNRLR